jgi:uncharacterized protein (DUF1697 family)
MTYIAVLKGVNVGAKGIVSIAAMKALLVLDLSDVRSPCAVRAPSRSGPHVGRLD